jgi:hypothetical protein
MNKFGSIFGQILQIFSKRDFYEAAHATGADHGEEGFTCRRQFADMLSCRLGQAQSPDSERQVYPVSNPYFAQRATMISVCLGQL